MQNNLHRWYDPATGTWISVDPIGFAGDPGNLYRYCGNSPGNWIGPSGLVVLVQQTEFGQIYTLELSTIYNDKWLSLINLGSDSGDSSDGSYPPLDHLLKPQDYRLINYTLRNQLANDARFYDPIYLVQPPGQPYGDGEEGYGDDAALDALEQVGEAWWEHNQDGAMSFLLDYWNIHGATSGLTGWLDPYMQDWLRPYELEYPQIGDGGEGGQDDDFHLAGFQVPGGYLGPTIGGTVFNAFELRLGLGVKFDDANPDEIGLGVEIWPK